MITITTATGTATAGDYGVPSATTLTIPAGQTTATVTVPTVVDALVEGPEAFTLTATVTSSNTSNPSATGTGTIIDNTIVATDDNFSTTPINGGPGGTTPSIFTNDTIGTTPVTPTNVILTILSIPSGFTLNPNGTISVATNTAPGTYTVSYQICTLGTPASCDTAIVTILVKEPCDFDDSAEACDIAINNYLYIGDTSGNGFFNIKGIGKYPDNIVEIYNRWGVLVFETKGYDNTNHTFVGMSEGRVNVNVNEELPIGTYYYILKYTKASGTVVDKAGFLYINRK